jgi:hypothetical protein
MTSELSRQQVDPLSVVLDLRSDPPDDGLSSEIRRPVNEVGHIRQAHHNFAIAGRSPELMAVDLIDDRPNCITLACRVADGVCKTLSGVLA